MEGEGGGEEGRDRGNKATKLLNWGGVVCTHIDELRDGSLAARPTCAKMAAKTPGVGKVIVSLVSLLAAMVGTRGPT